MSLNPLDSTPAMFSTAPAEAASGAVAQPSDSELSPTVAALQPFVERHELAGAVALVANKEGILSLEAVGYADVTAQQPMRADALFWIASQTKPITATALMMLVDEGKVNINDPVEKYLPEFAGQMFIAEQDEEHVLLQKPAHPITVKNVLNHTSGLRFVSPLEQPTIDMLPLRDAVRSYAMTSLDFEPDTGYLYSNMGTNIAGRILEVVSGVKYEEWMQQRLFDPLGMSDTSFWPNAEQIARLAHSYKPNEANTDLEATTISYLHDPLDDPARQAVPAGGLFSTARDVAQFCRMILNGGELDGRRYISEASIREMSRRQTADGLESYGLGWGVGEEEFGHGGAYATSMNIYPARGLIIVFLVQHAGFPGNGGESRNAFKQAALGQFG